MPTSRTASRKTEICDERIRGVVDALNEIVETSILWPRGLINRGGPHRRIKGMSAPISIAEDECQVFGKIIDEFQPKNCFIIGNGFGFSAAYIGKAMMENDGESIVTLDCQSEGDGEYCAQIAQQLADRLELSIVKNKKGYSPQDVPDAVEDSTYEMIFIDGKHSHPQVTHDFNGVLPYSDKRTIFVWHDFWIRGIPASVGVARSGGVNCWWIPTSCEMVVGTADETMFARIKKLFPNGKQDRRGMLLSRFLSIVLYELTFRHLGVWYERFAGGNSAANGKGGGN